jgi:Family of unknown function (DUF5681)
LIFFCLTGEKQMPRFKKGQSGNPKGRPPDVSVLRALLEPHAPALVNKAVELALRGDASALRLCLDRLIPPIKAKDEAVSLGNLSDDLAKGGRTVLQAASTGRITPCESSMLMQGLSAQARIVEIAELEQRITALEAQQSHEHREPHSGA